ncbi:MAG: hypothetical protein K2J15_00590, partial [Muribaculaceae bacterium]|nr:hypothetical protein [Muribaculaceae bacterium]
PEGILKITFDKPLGQSPKTVATLSWGNQEGEVGEYYVEELPVVINENILSIDFTGKLRTPATMTPLFPQASYPTIIINVSGIVDENGVPVGSPGPGTVGSYGFSPAYKVLERTSIAAEFEPASGADLDLASNVNVWISGIKNFTFDGFNIEYTDKTTGIAANVTVPMSDVKVTPDGDDAAEYDFAMPKAVLDNAASAIVTLSNLLTLDGYSHENDVRAVYGGFVVTYADPANGAEMATLDDGTVISIETNLSEKYPEMYIEYDIINLNPGEDEEEYLKTTVWMNRQGDGSYQSTVAGNYKLMYGKEYKVVFKAWESEMIKNYSPEQTLGSDYIIWKGLTPPYLYSQINFTGISPEDEATLDQDMNTITLTFDGIVNLGKNGSDTGIVSGMGGGLIPFRKLTPVDPQEIDGKDYASVWNLEFSDGYVANQTAPVLITVVAYDEDGRRVKGNIGKDEGTYFQFTYYPAGMFKDIEISFGEEPISSVSEITVGFPIGINVSWEYDLSEVKVFDRNYTEVATMSDYIPSEDPENPFATITEGKIVLDNPVTQEGSYILVIPRGFFELGTEFTTYKNNAVNQLFTISAASYLVGPEAGVVNSLLDVTVTYLHDGDISINEETVEQPTWSKVGEYSGMNFGNVSVFGNNLTLSFDDEITEVGEYTVTVPEGYILYADGTPAPAVNVTYTIEGGVVERPNVTVLPAEGKVASLPAQIVIYFDDYEEVGPGMGKATLTINGETPVNLPDSDIDWEDDALNKILQPLGQEYTADGTYVISFPKGYFSLGANGDASPAFTLTYTIGEAGNDGPDVTAVPAAGSVTSIPATITLYFNDAASVGPGMGKATLTID